jgi:uncharacterized protein YwgA
LKIFLDSNDLVLAIVTAAPNHRVEGKKRLQKFAYFLKSVGVKSDASFKIRDFGPFSSEVARAADWLTVSGKLKEQEKLVASLKKFITVYSVDIQYNSPKRLDDRFEKIVKKLDTYSSVELEVAATIQFFLKEGLSNAGALRSVRELKPTKALPKVISKSLSLIEEIEATL